MSDEMLMYVLWCFFLAGYALQGGLKFSLYDVFREMIAPGQERPSMVSCRW